MTSTKILSELIKYQTITPEEKGIYKYIKSLLPNFEYFEVEGESKEPALNGQRYITKNIFLYKLPLSKEDFNESSEFKNYDTFKKFCFENKKHLCFAGHIDVVPPGENWTYNPFTPLITDDKNIFNIDEIENLDKKQLLMYGRGTQDMKGGVACFIAAINNFLKANKNDFIISILLTSDEEGHGEFGTKYILDSLKEQNILPTHAIVAEPTSNKRLGDTIKVGRRGSINGEIIIQGKQGHAAYPDKCINPIELVASRLNKIAGINLCEGDENFLPSKMVVTNIFAGLGAVNVVPDSLKIMFNVRNSTLVNRLDIKNYIEKVFQGLDFSLKLTQSAEPFITKDQFLINIAKKAVNAVCNITPECTSDGGTSDARFFAKLKIPTIEIGVQNDRIHSINERVCLNQLEELENIFYKILNYYK